MIQKSVLLGENLHDCRFYKMVAKVYASNNRLGTLKLNCEDRLGGGSSITDVYRYTQEEDKRLCLCVVDSDKEFPSGNLGLIAHKLTEIDDESKPISRCIHLSCREVENMFSCKQLDLVIRKEATRMEARRVLGIIEKCNRHIRFYIDIKNGLTIEKILKLPNNPCRKYWIDSILAIQRSNGKPTASCLGMSKCYEKDKDCACTIMPGFGEAILENVVEELDRYSIPKIDEMLCEIVRDEWMRVGQVIFSWCVGRNRQVAF